MCRKTPHENESLLAHNVWQQRNATLFAFVFLARMCVALYEHNLLSKYCINLALPKERVSLLHLLCGVRRSRPTPCLCPNLVLICSQPIGATMPIIKSISSLRHRTREIASICHKKDEPVYLTTNGEGDLVVMTIDHYERLKARIDLFEKLGVAQAQSAAGKRGITHRQMMTKLRRRVNAR